MTIVSTWQKLYYSPKIFVCILFAYAFSGGATFDLCSNFKNYLGINIIDSKIRLGQKKKKKRVWQKIVNNWLLMILSFRWYSGPNELLKKEKKK